MVHVNTPPIRLEIAEPGWRAVYREGDALEARAIAAWALMRPPGATRTVRVGVVVDGDRIADADHAGRGELCGYAPPGAPLSDFLDLQDQLANRLAHLSPSLTRPASHWFG